MGKGRVIVVGSVISGEDVVRLTGLNPICNASENIELIQRGDYIIAVEIENKKGCLELHDSYVDILTDKMHKGAITMDAFSVMVLKKKNF